MEKAEDYRGEEVRFLDRASRAELGRLVMTGSGPQGVAITPDGRRLIVSLSSQSRVAIVDVASRSVLGHLSVGETPDGVAYTTFVVPRTR